VRYPLLSLLLCTTIASGALAQSGKTTIRESKESSRKKATALSTEQTDAALAFASTHHAELAELLKQLRDKTPAGYKRGIREVHRTVQRLERLQEKQPTRYADKLRNWKTHSRIQLLTARWVMSQDPTLEEQIQELLRQRQTARIERLSANRKKLTKQLQQLVSEQATIFVL
jgi:hypothetical protein